MKKIMLNVKNTVNANYFFMCLVSIIFGVIASWGTKNESISTLTSSTLILKGYFFIYIMFAVELSKEMLQKEKISRRVEWLLANKIPLVTICMVHITSLFISTVLLMLPLIIMTFLMGEEYSLMNLLDFYASAYIYGIIINMAILYIKNMNRFKSLSLNISVLYIITTAGELSILLIADKMYLSLLFKYTFSILVGFVLWKLFSKERAVSAYF